MLKLYTALDLFDSSKGVKFITYGYRAMQTAQNRYMETYYKERKVEQEYQKEYRTLDHSEQPNYDYVYELLGALTGKERDVIIKLYGLEGDAQSVDDVASFHNVSRRTLYYIREEALGKLLDQIRSINKEITE